jgi:hypothetical protein
MVRIDNCFNPDARTIKPIMEWKSKDSVASCFAQFSFDETSILDVSANGTVRNLLMAVL